MKKLICIIMAVAMVLGLSSMVFAANELKLTVNSNVVYIDGNRSTLDVPATVTSGVTIVPFRFISENMDCTIDYNSTTKTVTMQQGSKNVLLVIGSKIATVNGKKVALLSPAVAKNGRTLVPIRFMSEELGMSVYYDSKTKGITIKNGGPSTSFVADFNMPDTVNIGEKVTYTDISVSPEGNKIVDRIWSGNKNYFSDPGSYTVSLKVKDSKGNFSTTANKTIKVVAPNGPNAKFNMTSDGNKTLGGNKFYVGETITYTDLSSDSNGLAITSSIWQNKHDTFDVPGTYIIGQKVTNASGTESSWYYTDIVVEAAPNRAPIARFSAQSNIDQGVAVDYKLDCSDPDGDEIIAYDWVGNDKAFWGEGQHTVTLKVKDKKGLWSEPYTQIINVSNKVVRTKLQFFCDNPVAGDTLDVTEYKVLDFNLLNPTYFKEDNSPLLMSNSPETVKANGILYADTVHEGLFRLLYSHKNGVTARKQVYVIAENMTDQMICVSKMKSGQSGPSKDELNTGRTGLLRYLASDMMQQNYLQPHERVIIDGPGKSFGYNELVYGIMDYHTTGDVKISYVIVDENTDVMAQLDTLQPLDKDQHIRGTFLGANRTYYVKMTNKVNSRFIIGSAADQKVGIDALTGLESINKGNYGITYSYEIESDHKVAIFTNPRGGLFLGAGLLPDGTSYNIPDKGLIKDGSLATMHMVLPQYGKTEYVFMPPAASNLPVAILMMPID